MTRARLSYLVSLLKEKTSASDLAEKAEKVRHGLFQHASTPRMALPPASQIHPVRNGFTYGPSVDV